MISAYPNIGIIAIIPSIQQCHHLPWFGPDRFGIWWNQTMCCRLRRRSVQAARTGQVDRYLLLPVLLFH